MAELVDVLSQLVARITALEREVKDLRRAEAVHRLGDLRDVLITTPTDGDVLTWDDVQELWVNEALP